MSTVQSLEQERQAILERMQMRREAYKRVLNGEQDFEAVAPRGNGSHAIHGANAGRRFDTGDGQRRELVPETMGSAGRQYSYRRVPDRFPRTRLMQTVAEHPMLWALGVAAVVAIGPRRIAKGVTTSTAAFGALASSQSGMDMLGRVLTLVGAFAQRKGS